jgi:hypothetical protein
MRLEDYAALGGHVDFVRPIEDVLREQGKRIDRFDISQPWPLTAGRTKT